MVPVLQAALHLCVIRAPPLLGIVFTCFLLGLVFPQILVLGVVGEGVGTGEALPQPISEQDAQ